MTIDRIKDKSEDIKDNLDLLVNSLTNPRVHVKKETIDIMINIMKKAFIELEKLIKEIENEKSNS